MRHLLLTCLFLLLATPGLCALADPDTAQEVRATLEDIALDFMAQDQAALLDAMEPDAGLIIVGPGRASVGPCKVMQAFHRSFQEDSTLLSFSLYGVHVGKNGGTVWYAADCLVRFLQGDQRIAAPARWTGVMVREKDRWLLTQSHFAFTEQVYSIDFREIDSDADGMIGVEEFRTIYPQTAEEIMGTCDLDGSGAVSPEEWETLSK